MDMDQLRLRWREVPDEEIIKTAFTDSADVSPAALAVVYEEFVRRGLKPPDPKRPDCFPPYRTFAQRHPFLVGVLVYYLSLVSIVVLATVVTGPAATDLVEFLVAAATSSLVMLPPGVIAIWYTIRLLGGFQPDPEGHTRCGHCGYILRGLSEPRCPECGNRL